MKTQCQVCAIGVLIKVCLLCRIDGRPPTRVLSFPDLTQAPVTYITWSNLPSRGERRR
jgi:hypothetical protein